MTESESKAAEVPNQVEEQPKLRAGDLFREAELDLYIAAGPGTVVYDSRLDFKSMGIDEDMLHSCIEENIYDDSDEDGEMIDWSAVERDYLEMLAESQE